MDQNKSLRGVAEAVARIMMGEKALHPNQQKLDVHEPEKDELTSDDFKKLRSMKKEEIEDVSEMDYGGGKNPYAGHGLSRDDDDDGKKQLTAKVEKSKNVVKSALDILNKQSVNKKDVKKEEVDLDEGKMGQLSADLKDLSHADFHKEYGKPKSHYDPSNFKKPVQPGKEMDRAKSLAQRGMASMKKEEVEELEEMFPGTPEYEKKYGKVPQDMKKGEKKKTSQGEMEKTEKGVVHKRKFSEMVESYTEGGVKGLFKTLAEEPTNAEFTAQLDDAKKRADGTKKQAEVAKAAVQAVQNEEVELTLEDFTAEELELFMQTEEYEQLDELSKGTLKSYIKGATKDAAGNRKDAASFAARSAAATTPHGFSGSKFTADKAKSRGALADKREGNIAKAKAKLAKEEVELEERSLSEPEMKKKEEIVKIMKKNLQGFKDRYGDRAKEVMYATATANAKKSS